MPNPKGNPQNLQPIKSNREESLTERINLRITKTMKEELSTKDDPPEFCRRAIQEALDKDREK
ncbi:MAG: hypothetical protein V7K69_17400 [Nostoc sp.]|jgi:hypothetical protein|uniref:hypothetical protein n=1 Tax=unclassified Nostoc TaxID=2593658 RepID=UPI0015C3B9CF|nr:MULTISPECIES: hypothetical protein [unclassified Nostoc]MCC5608321.1 hypothetical protein [Nostoc sp. CHAB 5834]MCC5644278.1 hypothetical protein [Nostoc sp. CHAB 5824]MBD2521268.1 hypothetical protein [Nostoc sp. FACHB-133]MBE8998505.1 hypothetical protein [Nostoc sp. LEGE 12447]MCC5622116.1 hypothetical protein [Nostoc sp. CHAB 5715]